MNTDVRPAPLEALAGAWRARADDLGLYAPPAAAAFERAAAELERAMANHVMEPLTLAQAERESGYSRDHLGRMVRDGAIPNAGRHHAPRILRRDLPRKVMSKTSALALVDGDQQYEDLRRAALESRTRR